MSRHPVATHEPAAGSGRLERIAGLLGWQRPVPGAGITASYPPCPPFYAPRVVAEPQHALELALSERVIVYLQGATEGVGVSEFLTHVADLANEDEPYGGGPVLLFSLFPTDGRTSRFLDALGDDLGVQIKSSDLSSRSVKSLSKRILWALRLFHVRVVVVDHAHHLSDVALTILGHLMSATQGPRPTLGPQLDEPISFVFASHLDPRHVLSPELAARLDLHPVQYGVYGREDIAAVLPQLDLAGPEVDLEREEDRELVDAVYEATQGHVARMNPLFRCMRVVLPPGAAADMDAVRYAVRLTEGMTRLLTQEAHRMWEWEPATRHRLVFGQPAATSSREPKAEAEVPRLEAPSRARVRKLREDRARAETVRRELTRRRPSRKRSR